MVQIFQVWKSLVQKDQLEGTLQLEQHTKSEKTKRPGHGMTFLIGSRSSDFILQDMENRQRTSDTDTTQP